MGAAPPFEKFRVTRSWFHWSKFSISTRPFVISTENNWFESFFRADERRKFIESAIRYALAHPEVLEK
jgi:hypothetical protein